MTEKAPQLPAIPADLTPEDRASVIRDLAKRHADADTGLMRAINSVGGAIETPLKRLPQSTQDQLQRVVRAGLEQAYKGAAASERAAGPLSSWQTTGLAVVSGAGAGALGPVGYGEIPLTITLIFREIRAVARSYGFDPEDEVIKQVCLSVFASGGPLPEDDGVDSALISARVALSGPGLTSLLNKVSARLAQAIAQKMGAQTIPVLGALGGGAVNYAFMRYYTAMAHVTFGLRRLAMDGSPGEVTAEFRRALALPQVSDKT
ncbi:MAG: EcsC family protein [Pseudomonadota bacterium]